MVFEYVVGATVVASLAYLIFKKPKDVSNVKTLLEQQAEEAEDIPKVVKEDLIEALSDKSERDTQHIEGKLNPQDSYPTELNRKKKLVTTLLDEHDGVSSLFRLPDYNGEDAYLQCFHPDVDKQERPPKESIVHYEPKMFT